MRNIKLIISYNGANYCGWQIQPGEITIQEKVEDALSKTFHEEIKTVAAGRTDAGVHALGQVVNFYAESDIDIGNLPKVINFHLPEDISIIGAEYVEDDFSARYCAKSKTYKYIVYNHRYRNAVYGSHTYQYPFPVEVDIMKEASKLLIGEKDFKSFMGRKAVVKDSIRTIYEIDIIRNGDFIEFTFYGKSFLKNMIRIMVGTLLEIGRGKLTTYDLKNMLEEKDRSIAGPTAGANGLYLVEVHY